MGGHASVPESLSLGTPSHFSNTRLPSLVPVTRYPARCSVNCKTRGLCPVAFLLRPGGAECLRPGVLDGERLAGCQLAAIPPQHVDLPRAHALHEDRMAVAREGDALR